MTQPDAGPTGGGTEGDALWTPVFESERAGSALGGTPGFLCVWPDRLTFVASKWVRYGLAYVSFVPARYVPSGPDDPRTRTVVRFEDLAGMASTTAGSTGARKAVRTVVGGRKVAVTTRDGATRYYTGGQVNAAFGFDTVVPLVVPALEAAGHEVTTSGDTFTVTPRPAAAST